MTFGRLTYVLEAFLPLAFVPLRSRLPCLAVPGFAIVLLANSGLVWRMGKHYAALWIPWLLIAFGAGVATYACGSAGQHRVRTVGVVFVASARCTRPLSQPSYHALNDARAALACVPPAERSSRRTTSGIPRSRRVARSDGARRRPARGDVDRDRRGLSEHAFQHGVLPRSTSSRGYKQDRARCRGESVARPPDAGATAAFVVAYRSACTRERKENLVDRMARYRTTRRRASVAKLLERGETVHVWNRTTEKARALEADGAKAFDQPREAVRGASGIHVTLSDDATVDSVLEPLAD